MSRNARWRRWFKPSPPRQGCLSKWLPREVEARYWKTGSFPGFITLLLTYDGFDFKAMSNYGNRWGCFGIWGRNSRWTEYLRRRYTWSCTSAGSSNQSEEEAFKKGFLPWRCLSSPGCGPSWPVGKWLVQSTRRFHFMVNYTSIYANRLALI